MPRAMTIGEQALTFVLSGLGVLLWVLAARAIRLRLAMKRWPVVPGIVRDGRIRVNRRNQYVDVQVAYRIDGRESVTWCPSPTGAGYARGSSGGGAERDLAKTPTGSTINVHANPMRPSEAYLRLPEPHIITAMAGGGLILVGVAAASAFLALGLVAEQTIVFTFMLMLGVLLTCFAAAATVELFRR
jgi:hypothetical protein